MKVVKDHASSKIRLVDLDRDLIDIAELIELSFASHLDSDGHSYIRQLRRAAMDKRYRSWVPGASERITTPVYGYTWVEQGKIVGNLSMIPFLHKRKWLYLIANVAVHPDHRRKGIARQLTEKALLHIRSHGVQAVWLQVRKDNPHAIKLYQSMGFIERVIRTIWRSKIPNPPTMISKPTLTARKPTENDWHDQERWLAEVYPPEVAWYLSFNTGRFRPSVWQSLIRMVSGSRMEQWVLTQDDQLIGTAIWEPSRYSSDTLWAAPDPDYEDLTLRVLLPHIQQCLDNNRTLSVNYPYGQGITGFKAANFVEHNTLIWMEIKY